PPLEELARAIQHAIARDPEKPLYYDDHTIRTFLGSLASADLTLLQGPSGTGKTSLPLAVGRAIGASVHRIPVQAGWRDRADLVGDYNAFSERFRSTAFTEALYRARLPACQDQAFFVVLDECNLSQMEYYFADLLSELEDWSQDLKHIRLFDEKAPPNMKAPSHLKDGTHLLLPPNVRYFGTANQDETTFGIADKTYDRAAVILLEERAKKFAPARAVRRAISWSSLKGRLDEAIDQPTHDRQGIHKFVNALESLYMREFGFGLGNRFEERIVGQFLPVYVAAGGEASDGLDHLVRTRIVRRLERSRDPALIEPLHQLDALLVKQWPFTGAEPTASRLALEKVIKRVGG
ncbi:MAG: AAA family ATPase, partial [Myxococcales bacterium]|nr:AAA family ATPase [Myxococcales bacterium]